MLSEYERRELALIEQGLAEDDHALAESFRLRGASSVARGPGRWMPRSLLAFGVLLVVTALLTAADGLFMQGLLFGGAAVVWLRWQRRSAVGSDSWVPPQQGRSRPNGGPAQGWSRPT